MKIVYSICAIGLAITVISFTQRLVYWICKCKEGKALLKDMRPSNERYGAISRLYKHAKIEAVCWTINSIVSYIIFMDCVMQIFRG